MNEFDGDVYRKNDDGYEAARCAAVWNGIKPDRYPSVVVVAESRRDVVTAVELAQVEGLTIGIQSGGHSWVGNAVRDDGLLLDLSRLKAIEIDTASGIASFEPGVHVDELAEALAAEGYYFPVGHCPSVGVTGLVLGGGFGMNSAEVGMAAYSVTGVDVITAEGREIYANDEQHADLMWAVRGSGPGFFAVITRVYVTLRPMPAVIAASMQIHPMSSYDDFMAWYVDAGYPGQLVIGAVPAMGIDDKVLMIVNYAFTNTLAEARDRLAVLETAPHLDHTLTHSVAQPTTIPQLYGIFDQLYPEGWRYLSDNVWIDDVRAPGLWETTRSIVDSFPTQRSSVWVLSASVPHRHPNAAYSIFPEISVQVYAAYEDGDRDEEMRSWHRRSIDTIEPFSIGAGYVGDSSLFDRPMAIISPTSAVRLEQLRAKYDPEGRFFAYPTPLPAARL
ncbi:FAD-binding oxidoreductase [Rhodococcus qingshengii]|uniref:FAD-binding oxidoreductase n=1 Tax=Rhodococcus qingshengii TaxID=334542 RepID=UPI001BED3C96|nr:FAD-binding oxidoreductase [Rhodococcus qingshengii]MBT2271790.1 FAD-binding oxidoreductase [Rhodococcus qingshengii]